MVEDPKYKMKNYIFRDPPSSCLTEFGSRFFVKKWRDRIGIIHIKFKKSSVLSNNN